MSILNILEKDWVEKLRKSNFSFAKLYKELNVDQELSITVRSFQNMIQGNTKISIDALELIFNFLENGNKKLLLISYFKGGRKESLIEKYLKNSLNEAIPDQPYSGYENKESKKTYTEDQLSFLNKNTDAFRLHNVTLLFEKYDYTEAQAKYRQETIDSLISYRLLVRKNNLLMPKYSIYRLPQLDTSPASAIRERTEFLLKYLSTYINRENYKNQTIKFTNQLVPKKSLKSIRNHVHNSAEWIKEQTVVNPDEAEDLVPISYISFYKEFEKNEI